MKDLESRQEKQLGPGAVHVRINEAKKEQAKRWLEFLRQMGV